jgi:hypothetical protein
MSEELNETIAKMTIVEARLANVERVVSEGKILTNTSTNSDVERALNEYKLQMLAKLRMVRETLIAEGGDIQTMRIERDQAIKENLSLKKENERLNYRVRHLIKALNEEENKRK